MTPATASVPELISIPELSRLRLAGLEAGERAIRATAIRMGWRRTERHSRAGGHLYAVADLPEEARRDLESRYALRLTAANDQRRGRGRPAGTDWFTRHPDQAQAVLSYVSRHRHAVSNVLEMLEAEFDEVPTAKTLQRHIRRIEREASPTLLRQRHPDKAKGRNQLALGRADGGVTRAHERWELDTTKADVMTLGGRRMILGVIDTWSRRIRFLVAPSESGQSVRQLLIDTITAWGVMPEAVSTDNGSGYVNASIVSALEFLGIRHMRCAPGTPEHKPFVERMFGTFARKRAVLFDGFTGHSVADATAIRARNKKEKGLAVIEASMTPEQLQERLDAWVDGSYHLKHHGGIGMAPLDKLLTSPAPARRAPPPEHLRIALSALVGSRRIGKKGLVWKRHSYWCAELASFIDKLVVVRRNEDDLGALLVFDEDNHFIGTAVNHERNGETLRDFAINARGDQKSYDKAQDATIRAARRAWPIERARDKVFAAEDARAAKVVAIARPTVLSTTPQMDSLLPQPPAPLPDDISIARAEARFDNRRRQATALTFAEKTRNADAALAAHAAGEDVDPAVLRAAQAYARSSEYRVEKALAEDFRRGGTS